MAIEFKLTQRSHDILRWYDMDQGIDTLKALQTLKHIVISGFVESDQPSIDRIVTIKIGIIKPDQAISIHFKLIEFKTTIADDDSVTYSFTYKVLEDE